MEPTLTKETTQNNITLSDKETGNTIAVDYTHSKRVAMVLRAMNHKLRQRIMQLLDEKEQMIVTDIYTQLKLEQSVTSQHLGILRRVGIVTTKRNGKCIYYSVNYERVGEVMALVEKLLGTPKAL